MEAGETRAHADIASLQLFVWLGWPPGGTLALSMARSSTLRELKTAIYVQARPQGFATKRLFRHFLRLTRHPSWQRLEAYAQEDQTLKALGFGPEGRLTADLAERGGGLAFGAPQSALSSFLPPSSLLPSPQRARSLSYRHAIEFIIRLPKSIAPNLSCVVARVADVRELPSSPRLFMAQVYAVAACPASCVQPRGGKTGIDDA